MSQWAKDTALLLGILILGIAVIGLFGLAYTEKIDPQPLVTTILSILTGVAGAVLAWFTAATRINKAESEAKEATLRAQDAEKTLGVLRAEK